MHKVHLHCVDLYKQEYLGYFIYIAELLCDTNMWPNKSENKYLSLECVQFFSKSHFCCSCPTWLSECPHGVSPERQGLEE